MKILSLTRPNFLRIPVILVFALYMILIAARFVPINKIAMLMIIGLILFRGLVYFKDIKLTRTVSFLFIIVFYNMILLIFFPSIHGLYYFFVQLISFTFITILTLGTLEETYLKRLSNLFNTFYYIFSIVFLIAIALGKVNMTEQSFALGIYQPLFALSYFMLLQSKRPYLIIVWLASMPFLSGERGIAISLIISILIYYLIPILKLHKQIYKLFFWVVAFGVTSFQFVYVWLSSTELGIRLNQLSGTYTEQNFFSGRQTIWGVMNDLILDSPFYGYGIGVGNSILESYNINMSAHNTYVEILLSGGFVALFLFFGFMYSIWVSMFEYLGEKSIRLSMSFLIATLIFGVNGVIFIGNDMSFTLFIWLIIGIASMRRNYIRQKIRK